MKVTKIDWFVFLSASEKQFPSEKTAYHAKVETQALTKQTVKVREYALEIQQLFEKSWCSESAATIKLTCKESLTT